MLDSRGVSPLTTEPESGTLAGVIKVGHRLLALLIVVLWLAPGLGVVGVALHLSFETHGHGAGAGHSHELKDLARAAAHGHHHDTEAAPDHEHDATVDGFDVIPRRLHSQPAAFAEPVFVIASLTERDRVERSPLPGPPRPLFTANCSLLL